jgi:hypothetical protein
VGTVSTQPSPTQPAAALADLLSPQPALAAVHRLCVGTVDKNRFESVVRRYFILLRCAGGIDGSGLPDDSFALEDQVLADQAFLLRGFGIRVPTTRDVRAARDALTIAHGRGGLAPPGHLQLVSDRTTAGQQDEQQLEDQHEDQYQ